VVGTLLLVSGDDERIQLSSDIWTMERGEKVRSTKDWENMNSFDICTISAQ
jgi:hypothetical protein